MKIQLWNSEDRLDFSGEFDLEHQPGVVKFKDTTYRRVTNSHCYDYKETLVLELTTEGKPYLDGDYPTLRDHCLRCGNKHNPIKQYCRIFSTKPYNVDTCPHYKSIDAS